MSTATRWKDAGNTSPPQWWNGSAYVVDDASRLGVAVVMTATANAGDTVSFTFDNLVADTGDPNPMISLLRNGTSIWSEPLNVVASGITYTSPAFAQGDAIEFFCNASNFPVYGIDLSLTPIKTYHIVPQSPITIIYD